MMGRRETFRLHLIMTIKLAVTAFVVVLNAIIASRFILFSSGACSRGLQSTSSGGFEYLKVRLYRKVALLFVTSEVNGDMHTISARKLRTVLLMFPKKFSLLEIEDRQ